MTKIIIRYQTPSNLPTAELNAAGKEHLKKAAGFADIVDQDIEFSPINPRDPFQQSYYERAEIIHEGMQLLIDSLPADDPINTNENSDKVKAAAKRVFDEFSEKIKNLPDTTDIKAYQKLLIEYLQILAVLLKHAVTLPKGSDPIKLLQKAEEWATARRPCPTICTIIPYNVAKANEAEEQNGYLVQIDEPLEPLSDDIRQAFLDTQIAPPGPLWFQLMSKAEQSILNQILNGAKTTKEVAKRIPSLPNRLSHVPGVRNFWKHSIKMVKADDSTVVWESSARRSSIISADEIEGNKKDQETARKTIAEQNLKHVIATSVADMPPALAAPKKPLILVQSLLSSGISPIALDKKIYEDKRQAIITQNDIGTVEIVDTNHAINGIGHVDRTKKSGPSGVGGRQLIKRAKAYARDIEANNPNPKQALQVQYIRSVVKEYKKLLQDRKFWDGRSREFHLASYEDLLVRLLKGDSCDSYGSCASGKDRFSQKLTSTDSDFIFLYQHGKAPNYDDANNHQECRELHALMFCSGHHQRVASANAPGSAGIVCPPRYLTSKRQQAIIECAIINGYPHPERILDNSDLLANNNNLKKIANDAKKYGVNGLTQAEEIAWGRVLLRPQPAVASSDSLQPTIAKPFSFLTNREETKTAFEELYTLNKEELQRLVFEGQDSSVQKATIEVSSKAIKITNGDIQTCCDAAERLIRLAQPQCGNSTPLTVRFTTNSEEKFNKVKRICGEHGVRVYRGEVNNGVNPGRGPGLFAPCITSPAADPTPDLTPRKSLTAS